MQNRFAKFISFMLSMIFYSIAVSSQSLSGEWVGTYSFLREAYPFSIHIEVKGDSLFGIAESKNVKTGDFTEYKVIGEKTNQRIVLKGTEFISKKGSYCLPVMELNLLKNDETLTLNGRWKFNLVKNGCLPGASGNVNLVKKDNGEITVQATEGNRSISDDDEIGNQLYAALKERNYHALIIGINQYDDPRIVDLDNPVNDAGNLKDILTSSYSFKNEHVQYLANPTRSEIFEAFEKLRRSVLETDNLLIFYAGHGEWDQEIEQGYWLPSDAKLDSRADWISNGTIRDYIRGINSKHTLLISDACFSGGILKERRIFNDSKAMLELYKLPSRKAMTSGHLKTVPDKSVFVEYLVKNLQRNTDPFLSASSLFNKLKNAVINNSLNGQVPQYGVIQQADDEGGDFIFIRER